MSSLVAAPLRCEVQRAKLDREISDLNMDNDGNGCYNNNLVARDSQT
jgi:hypothetical protein